MIKLPFLVSLIIKLLSVFPSASIDETISISSSQPCLFLANRKNESGIVYCLSQKLTEQCAEFLQSEGFNSYPFHAGLDTQVKIDTQDKFMTEDNVVVCATIRDPFSNSIEPLL